MHERGGHCYQQLDVISRAVCKLRGHGSKASHCVCMGDVCATQFLLPNRGLLRVFPGISALVLMLLLRSVQVAVAKKAP